MSVNWKYPSKYGGREGRCCILNSSKYGSAVLLEGNEYWLSVDKFIQVKIQIDYNTIWHREIDD